MSDPSAKPAPIWRRGAPGLASLALFALIGAALLYGVVLIFATVRAERAERLQVARTAEVLEALRDLGLATVNAETGQRGYLLTLDRRYLASYQLGAATYPETLRRLHRLLDPAANGEQRGLVARAEALADAKFGEMAETVALIDDGRVLDARARLLSDEGQDLMVELRATLGELERIESGILKQAAANSSQVEARMLPLLVWLGAAIVVALALGLWLVARVTRAEAAAANAAALREARDRADLLARELNHRVKNLFGMILAIVQMSGRGAPEAKPVLDKIVQRIEALVTAHQVTQGAGGGAAVDLGALVEAALAPYCGDRENCTLSGGLVPLHDRHAVPLGLVLHELATNAVKYGAFAQPGGTLEVTWRGEDGTIRLDWREVLPNPPVEGGREGFGSRLMATSARQLRGSIDRVVLVDGLEVRIAFPAA